MLKKIKKKLRKKRSRSEISRSPYPAAGNTSDPTSEEAVPAKKAKKRRCACCKKVKIRSYHQTY